MQEHSPVAPFLRQCGACELKDRTDAELFGRFRDSAGAAAFAALVRRRGGLLRRVCRRVLRDPHDAEDAFPGPPSSHRRHVRRCEEGEHVPFE